MSEPQQVRPSVRLETLAHIDPDTLSETTNPRFRFKYIDISCASDGKLTLPSGFIEFVDAPSRARKILKNGDVIISTVRPNLKAFAYCRLVDGPYIASTGFAVLRAKENVDAYFLLSALLSDHIYNQIESYAVGSNYPAINSSDVRRLQLPVFTPKDQRAIGRVLAIADTTIEKTETLIAKYQQIKAGLMRDLFTRGVLPNGQLRPPLGEAPELYQETAIGWIPKEWKVSGLALQGRPGTSWLRTGPFGSALKGEHWRSHGHPVITIGALGEGVFTSEELLFVSVRDASRLFDFQLKSGDVVFSRVADVGRSVVVRDEQAGWIMSSNLMRISVDERCARPDFLQLALAGDVRIKAQIRARVNTGGRDVANSEVLNQLRFVWPDISEQDRIISLLSRASRNLISEQQKAAKLRLQKLGLMQDLLSGKVAVKVDEPEAGHA
ncbi:MAG TPA: restriction endonuclease subunit S [Paraburkholderia sp.]